MKTSLQKDIINKLRILNEQAAAPAPPGPDTGIPPLDAGAAPPADEAPKGAAEKKEEGSEAVEAGQPIIDPENPTDAIYDYGFEVAKDTVDPQRIYTAFVSAIQANPKGDVVEVIQRIKSLKNPIMDGVAERIELFSYGTIGKVSAQTTEEKIEETNASLQETSKGKYMKVSREEIRSYVKEAVKMHKSVKKHTTVKEINLTSMQLEALIQKTVHRVINESSIFDSVRSQVGQVRSGIEQQLLSTDIQDMAIDLFEKICQKVGLDSENLDLNSPAGVYIKAELDEMIATAQDLGVKLMQAATVVETAKNGAGAAKPETKEGQG